MWAGSADLHEKITGEHGSGEELPCPDFALLVPLKKSGDYRTLRPRVAHPKPADAWQEEGLHFFVFELRPEEGASPGPEPPLAVFTMHPQEPTPISVVIVTPSAGGDEAEVRDFRRADSRYTAPYPRSSNGTG